MIMEPTNNDGRFWNFTLINCVCSNNINLLQDEFQKCHFWSSHFGTRFEEFFSVVSFCFLSAVSCMERHRSGRWVDQDHQRSPSPRLQKQVAGSGGDGKHVKRLWRSGVPNAQFPNKVRTLETAIAAFGPHDTPVKAELEAALDRAKIQFQGKIRISPTPDVVVSEAKKNVFRLEKALEAFGDSRGFHPLEADRGWQIRCVTCIEQSRRGGCETEVWKASQHCVHGGELSLLEWVWHHGSVVEAHTFRSVTSWIPWHSRWRGSKPRSQGGWV